MAQESPQVQQPTTESLLVEIRRLALLDICNFLNSGHMNPEANQRVGISLETVRPLLTDPGLGNMTNQLPPEAQARMDQTKALLQLELMKTQQEQRKLELETQRFPSLQKQISDIQGLAQATRSAVVPGRLETLNKQPKSLYEQIRPLREEADFLEEEARHQKAASPSPYSPPADAAKTPETIHPPKAAPITYPEEVTSYNCVNCSASFSTQSGDVLCPKCRVSPAATNVPALVEAKSFGTELAFFEWPANTRNWSLKCAQCRTIFPCTDRGTTAPYICPNCNKYHHARPPTGSGL